MNREMVCELAQYRGLLGMLAWRDIRVRYKQSIMGFAWAFLMPLIQTVVLYLIFNYGIGRDNMSRDLPGHMPYFFFVLSGVVPWTFFSSAVAMSIESLTRNSRLVTKIYFPREVFPLGSVVASLVDFGVASILLLIAFVYFIASGKIHPTGLMAMLPVVIIIQTLLVAGLSLILSMANLFFRDVKYIMTFVLQLWFFATNVMYPLKFASNPKLGYVAQLNPMISILDAYRDCLAGQSLHNPVGLIVAAAIALMVFFFGWTIFHRAEFKFAEYV